MHKTRFWEKNNLNQVLSKSNDWKTYHIKHMFPIGDKTKYHTVGTVPKYHTNT